MDEVSGYFIIATLNTSGFMKNTVSKTLGKDKKINKMGESSNKKPLRHFFLFCLRPTSFK